MGVVGVRGRLGEEGYGDPAVGAETYVAGVGKEGAGAKRPDPRRQGLGVIVKLFLH